ncbi:MAG: alpha/beta fold hydrolase [Phormidesmis sp. RL_2_1]|nr:alpha/beta fold hydrolase [Phormidesmis sp. RL_2_1]
MLPAHMLPAHNGAYWCWRGYRVHYVRSAQADQSDLIATKPPRPPLLLIHGFGASTDHWRKNIADLQTDFDVYALDLIGFGRSSKPSSGYSPELWRDQIVAFITQIIQRPAVVAGNSIGGYSSLYAGATCPDAVVGVCLLNGVGAFSEQQTSAEPNPFQKAIGDLIKTVVLSPLPSWLIFQFVRKRSYIRKTLEQVYVNKAEVTDQLIEDIYRPATDPEAPAAFAALFKAERGEYVDTLLAQMSCPLLLIWGDGDPWMDTYARGALFQQHYQAIEEHHINAGHCPHDDAPAIVDQLLRNWVMNTVIPEQPSASQWVPLA